MTIGLFAAIGVLAALLFSGATVLLVRHMRRLQSERRATKRADYKFFYPLW